MTKNISIQMNKDILLTQNGFLDFPGSLAVHAEKPSDQRIESLGTVFSNLAYYGYVPSEAAVRQLLSLSDVGIYEFWTNLQPALAYVTGEDRNMGDHVVYKNFPQEVLKMSEAEYWIKQILMYWGMPNELFTEEFVEREPVTDKLSLKVLEPSDETTMEKIYNRLCKVSVKWTVFQAAQAKYLIETFSQLPIVIDEFSFKTNGVYLAAANFADITNGDRVVSFSAATDVLRLAAALSDGDVTLRQKTKFRKFSRPERRFLVGLLNGASHLEEDFAMRKEQWKRLISNLHPADFKYERVTAACDKLYNKQVHTIEALIEPAFANKDASVLQTLKAQPGQFLRRLHQAYDAFGPEAIDAFMTVTDNLTVAQLLKLSTYLQTIDDRKALLVTPKGIWGKAQVVENGKKKFEEADLYYLLGYLWAVIGGRLDALYPQGFNVDEAVKNAKLQGSGQELAPYGRGTVFSIPENMKFIRTASYWKNKEFCSTWFDNGWNFFDAAWSPVDTICWNSTPVLDDAAVFSGDPTNSKDLEGRACQMIDLYPEKLLEKGIRYAVWNVLCFSQIPFSDAEEVLATMQWGENPEMGELYEPARAQVVFPLTGTEKTKYVAYVDLVERKLVYMDVGLRGVVHSAKENEEAIAELMPAFLEYLDAQPSFADLFGHGALGDIPVLFNDDGVDIDGPAYVFQRTNAANKVEQINIEEILNAKGDVVTLQAEPDEGMKLAI